MKNRHHSINPKQGVNRIMGFVQSIHICIAVMEGEQVRELQIIKVDTGEEIARRCCLADRFFARLKGLLGKEFMPEGDGLLIVPCSSVHTIGMKISIDIVFLSSDLQVLHIIEDTRPGKVCPLVRGSSLVLELPDGRIKRCGLKSGDFLTAVDGEGDVVDFFSAENRRSANQ